MPEQHSVIIVGAGITGLATAWWLHKAGVDVVVLEHDSVVGGTMKSVQAGDWLIETGPNSALETTPLLKKLSCEVGIENDFLYANEAADNRYILRSGTLHPLPMKPALFLKSKLWSLSGKLRLLKEPFIGRSSKEETIAEFVSRRLGKEFLDYAINPFVAGVYAGNPEQLSVQAAFPKLYALEKNYGGLIKGQILGVRERKRRAEKAKDRSRLFSYKKGMQTLPDGIGKALGSRVHLNATVERVFQVSENGTGSKKLFNVTGSESGKNFSFGAKAVVLAIPSYQAATIIEPLDLPLATSLKNIYYPPVAEVYLGFKNGDIRRPLDGFGFLIPEKERRSILGTIWSSVLFPGRAPGDCSALTSFVGGSRQPALAQRGDAELVELVVRELKSIMNVAGAPVFSRVTRWEKAIPQYRLGHLAVIEQINEYEKRNGGFFLSGNYRGGIAVGDCVINSEVTAERVKTFLASARDKISV
ncbi:MAG: protoporphyrinogen oxidase [Bacteroidota bacterium]